MPYEHVGILNADQTASINPATSGKQDELRNALVKNARLAGLTFAQTIGAGSFYETPWFDAREIPWTNYKGLVPHDSAFTATLTSSTAEDPDSPAAQDFESIAEATIAGTSLGAPNNTPSFSFAGGAWVKLKLTNLTGAAHDVKVVAHGFGQPMNPAIIPIGAGITRDYGATLMRGVVMGVDETTGEPANVLVDSFKNLFTRAVPRPASEAPGLERFEAIATHATANVTLKAAPGAGKRIVITDYVLTATNSSTGTSGQLHLRETDATGAVRIPNSMPTAASLSANAQLAVSHSFAEPIKLAEDKALFLHFAAGNVIGSVMVNGYVENV